MTNLPCLCMLSFHYISLVKSNEHHFFTKSGLRPWVDIHTPKAAYTKRSSRGENWTLVFSDEFNVPGRDFRPGRDYLWTALELPDGVNAALEWYSINATSTVTEKDGRGVFQIKTSLAKNITFEVFNAFTRPPRYMNHSMYYRSGMVQSWNKFCFQGGLLEVVAKLPGVTTSKNPDMRKSKRDRVIDHDYYPTWPGIWMMGNLARALFTKSTNRVWPWSYNECNAKVGTNQKFSACDSNPGHGLNPYQGRGAPEIDLLEGGGRLLSTSIQIAPGMPDEFRPIQIDKNRDDPNCVYDRNCSTLGANIVGVPTAVYAKRSHKTWYQKLKYFPNTNCNAESNRKQSRQTVLSNLREGITDNKCTGTNTCPDCLDTNADFGKKDNTTDYWGINVYGTCMAQLNEYYGSFLCDPDNTNPHCRQARKDNQDPSGVMVPFGYQMDAISANVEIPVSAYSDYTTYSLEWTLGSSGYVRWMFDGVTVFEVGAEVLTKPPNDGSNTNLPKLWMEEPMYLIMNVAVSSEWQAMPPNRKESCYGFSGTVSEKTKSICDGFPLYMKIDHMRLYQDVSKGSSMNLGCSPKSHPTREYIQKNINDFQDLDNPVIEVNGGAPCKTDDDCTVALAGAASIQTGQCVNKKCACSFSSWHGPRCTLALSSRSSWGPSFHATLGIGVIQLIILMYAFYRIIASRLRQYKMFRNNVTGTTETNILTLSHSQSDSKSVKGG